MATNKSDPISDKARALNDEIAALEAEIKKLDSQLLHAPPQPRFRSTATAQGGTVLRGAEKNPPPPPKADPVFEVLKHGPLTPPAEPQPPEIFNELGVRRYDLPGLWNRIRSHFQGPTTSNPRLVNYLAAGGVQGLRPLRYEKRVARRRVLASAGVLFLIFLGILYVFYKDHR